MRLTMIGGATVKAVNRIEGHGLVFAEENRWLVHVVPETANSIGDKVCVKTAPPLAHLCAGEIGEHTVAGPHFAHVYRTIRILYEIVMGDPLFIGFVARKFGDVQVSDQNNLESFLPQIADHLPEGRKALRIHGEWAILLLVINIEVKHVGRNFAPAELAGDFAYPLLREVAIARLLKTKSEQRR